MGDTACHRHDRPRSLVQDAQAQRPELHVPQPLLACLQSNRLARECLADEHHPAVPLDAAVGAHAALLEAVGVLMLGQAAWQVAGSGRGDNPYTSPGGFMPSASCGRSWL
jgi:hypothetical protein